uniref:PEROXIDASE_4 domain-containing protein n=1 Tax=Heterorhabditis bacteriophora TaxID=37862 RepID=A0A1I7XUA4_HETBA
MAYNGTHTEAIREIDSIYFNDKCSSPSRKKFCMESNGSRLASSSVHVEVRLRKGVAKSQVEHRISDLQLALEVIRSVRNWKPISIQYLQHINNDKPLSDLIHSVVVGCTRTKDGAELCLVDGTLPFKLVRENTHFYRPSEDGPLVQNLAGYVILIILLIVLIFHLLMLLYLFTVDVSSDDTTAGSQLWQLPCIEFENIWENLIYDSDIKNESGKLVLNMFDQIDELADNGDCMVFVLIDEVLLFF